MGSVSANHQPHDYEDAQREEVLSLVPRGVSRVLDVGCHRGAFGKALKDREGCEVWGVEPIQDTAEVARQRLDRVLVGMIEQVMPELPPASFDLITFNDALEHMAWPDEVLRSCKPLLAPEGAVLASIPNIRFWPAMMEIVKNADFPYADSGIFDRTHLRFFTKRSIPRLFDQAGYRIEALQGINLMEGWKLKALNAATRGRFDDCRYLQFGVLARPL
jgi:2-polyprenyl-3-methyl-5-hydroxy-6-metoxy-1,4-benzoquinol methylase